MTDEQGAVLEAMVEASRRSPGQKREPFTAFWSATDGGTTVLHPGLPGGELEVYPADLEELRLAGMFIIHNRDKASWSFDLSSPALTTYSAMQISRGTPVERVEEAVRRYLSGDRFRARHPEAYAKWEQAENLLWESDSQKHLTTIGHNCREAMQAFGTSLLRHHPTSSAPSEATATKNRVAAVIKEHGSLGNSRAAFAVDLLALWNSVVDLSQRQEHGSAKEGDPLTWEDGHRLVLFTFFTMFELDRLLT
jgi:hypothetical protein